MTNVALDIFEQIILMCFFQVKCLSMKIPKNFIASSLFCSPIWVIVWLFRDTILLQVYFLLDRLKMQQFVFFIFNDNLFTHNQSYSFFNSVFIMSIISFVFGPDK